MKSWRGETLWQGVSVSLPLQARIGVRAASPLAGTSFLRLLAGREAPDRGRVVRAHRLRVALPTPAAFRRGEARSTLREYCLEAFAGLRARESELARLEQGLKDPRRTAEVLSRYGSLQEAFEQEGGYAYPGRVREVLEGLGVAADEADVALGELGPQGRMVARLGRVLLEDPDLLLLDEPARTLTPACLEWLARWLREWPGALVCAAPAGAALEADLESVWKLDGRGCEIVARSRPAALPVWSTASAARG